MKEKRCSVAVDLNKEKEEADLLSYAQKYRLPDGQEINVGQKRFLRPEGLFQTNLIGEPCEGNRGRTSLGAHMTALQSTGRATLLSGRVSSATLCCLAGTGSCSGLQFRMQKEISALVSPTINVKSESKSRGQVLFAPAPFSLSFKTTGSKTWALSVFKGVHQSCATYGAWVGGSILCSLSTFKDMWVTSKECKDFGSSIVTRRNF